MYYKLLCGVFTKKKLLFFLFRDAGIIQPEIIVIDVKMDTLGMLLMVNVPMVEI